MTLTALSGACLRQSSDFPGKFWSFRKRLPSSFQPAPNNKASDKAGTATMTIHVDFAARLRITALALGCATKKDLCARFQAANPQTQCDLDRLHKWTQGRALPRSAQVYEDWAKVLGTTRTGAWLATCAMDSFLAEVSALTGNRDCRSPGTRGAEPAPSQDAAALRPGWWECCPYRCVRMLFALPVAALSRPAHPRQPADPPGKGGSRAGDILRDVIG
jgi:hypothetical protein